MTNSYVKSIIKIKDSLNQVGSGFCLAKWYQVSMHLHTGQTHSCYHPKLHKIPLDELAESPMALHNTKWKKLQRKDMLEGKRPEECSYCWDIEDLKGVPEDQKISDRYLRSNEDWARDLLTETSIMSWDTNVYPRYLELCFSNECQMKCSYCSPMASSKWMSETEVHGLYPLKNHANYSQYGNDAINHPGQFYRHEDSNPYIAAFWEWFPSAYPYLKVLRVTGGEPLLSKNFLKMVNYIRENPRTDLEFSVNSNLSVPDKLIDNFLNSLTDLTVNRKLKSTQIYTSIDTWGKQAEWIRNGLDLHRFEKNLHRLLTEVPNSKVSIMITFCLLSIPNFNELLDKIIELREKYNKESAIGQRIFFDTPYMLEPPHLTCRIADQWFFDKMKESLEYMKSKTDDSRLDRFSTVEMLQLQRTHQWAIENQYVGEELTTNRNDFYRFVNEHDYRRGTSWGSVFPELSNFFIKCNNDNAT